MNCLIGSCNFIPEENDDPDQFNCVFHFLLDLNYKAPNYVLSYECALRMSSQFEASDDTKTLQNYLGQRKINSCEYIAQKDDIFKKKVVWCCLENRPIIRGLMLKADKLLERNEK